jgi:CheY-like chemotaxis protein
VLDWYVNSNWIAVPVMLWSANSSGTIAPALLELVKMPIVLVVDDSPVDQQLVGGLLRRDFDWIVEFADNGESAMQMIADIFPDVVVTDLQMPKMNGIELCKKARAAYPHVPVILTTGQGSERLAVEALNAGAASYVPKSALAESLNDTVDQILDYARKNKSKKLLMAYTTNCRHQFRIENDPLLIPPLLDFVLESMTTLKLGDQSTIRHATVALEEAVNNALYHGNLELNEKQARQARHVYREGDQHELVNSRRRSEPYKSRWIYVGIDLSKTKAQFIVRDQGKGFDTSILAGHDNLAHLSELSQRGLTLIRNFMDEVVFNDEGNEIRMALEIQR